MNAFTTWIDIAHYVWADAARHVEITSGDYILENMVDVFGNDEAKVAFYPSMDKKYRLWYKGRYLTIKREQKSPNSVTRAIQVLELRYAYQLYTGVPRSSHCQLVSASYRGIPLCCASS